MFFYRSLISWAIFYNNIIFRKFFFSSSPREKKYVVFAKCHNIINSAKKDDNDEWDEEMKEDRDKDINMTIDCVVEWVWITIVIKPYQVGVVL